MSRNILLLFIISLLVLTAGCSFGETELTATAGNSTAKKYYITPTTGAADKSIRTDLSECRDESILILVSSYYHALEDGMTSELSAIVTDPDSISDETFDKFKDVKSATVKKIYYMDGASPVDKILFVYYELELNDIETKVPSLDEIYISKADDSSWQIVNGAISTSVYSQLKELTDCEGVDNLVNSINLKFNEALEGDTSLQEYFDSQDTDTASMEE